MADRSILYRLLPALQGGFVSVASAIQTTATYAGVLSGITDIETGLRRFDGTGVGAAIFTRTSSYTAQGSNIDEWFGGRQQTRIRFTDDGPLLPPTFTLPGATALNTAFDTLVTNGLPETIRFISEYTGPSTAILNVVPRDSNPGTPQITGTSRILVRSGIAATVEVTRTGGVISDYVFQSIGGIGDGAVSPDTIKLINPAVAVWNASAAGLLPTVGVVKGNAYRVANAPSDNSGRFGEVMQNGDWVVWEGETFTAWATEPHAWSVFPAHDVRRITALEQDFLTGVQQTPAGTRNTVIRGADYADSAGEIRLKLYDTRGDYSAADLNTTGDVDVFTDPSDATGFLGIRLQGTAATLASILPTLYVYSDDGSGNFTRLGNLATDFTHEGDFGGESDYLSIDSIPYTGGDFIRVYVGSVEPRYNSPDLDIFTVNLSDELQARIGRSAPWESVAEVLFSGATVRDIHGADRIEYDTGYSRGIDWRDMAQSTTINANRYIDDELSITAGHASFEVSGFGNGLQKVYGLGLDRNDAETGEGAMMELAPGVAFIRVNTSNQIQVNTTPGSGSTNWATLTGAGPAVTLGASGNFLIFETIPTIPGNLSGTWRMVGVFFDGTTYTELNDITFQPSGTVTGDHIGISRSLLQRGEVTEFKAIKSPGYLTHSQLDSILRQHRSDKWDFGFARLYEGSDSKDVVFQTEIEIGTELILTASPNGTRVKLVADDTDTNNITIGVQSV